MVCYICKTKFTLLAQAYKTVVFPPKINLLIKVYKCEKGHYFMPIKRMIPNQSKKIPENLKKKKYIKYKPIVEKLTADEIEIRGRMPPLDMKNFVKIQK